MLVLTRKAQEKIRIGDDITISIIKVKGNAVRVGIDAPRDVRVVRGELPIFDEAAEADPKSERLEVELEFDSKAPLKQFVESRQVDGRMMCATVF